MQQIRSLTKISLIAACLTVLFAATANAAPSTIYASPGGSGIDCTQALPCSYSYAMLTKASDTDTVVLAGGNYAINSAVQITKAISVEGAKAGVPTRLVGGSGVLYTFNYLGANSSEPVHITDIQATNPAGSYAILVYGSGGSVTLDRVRGETGGSSSVGIFVEAGVSTAQIMLRNSVGRSTGNFSYGIEASGPPDGAATLDLRNVVGDTRTASGGAGIAVAGNGNNIGPTCGDLTVTMKNSYGRAASGPTNDIHANGTGTNVCTVILHSINSNWRASSSTGATIDSTGDQHALEASFVNAAAGDYHQLPGSPTIDAGTSDGALGPEDIDHDVRVQGAAPDIGADEFNVPGVPKVSLVPDVTPPIVSKLTLTPKGFLPNRAKPASVTATKKKKSPKGSKVSFTLSEAATVKFTVEQKLKGRKKGKACKAGLKTGKSCTFYKQVKSSFSRVSTVGTNTFTFSGLVNGTALKAGSYRLTAVPTDAAGNVGAPFFAAFTILKR